MRRSGSSVARYSRALGVALIAVVLTVSPAVAQQPGRIVAVTESVSVEIGATATVSLLVAAPVRNVVATLDSDKAAVGIRCGGVAASASAPVPAGRGPSAVSFCVSGRAAGSVRLVVVGNDGSSVSVAVTVTAPATGEKAAPEAPPALQLVARDDEGRLTVDPGFAMSDPLTVVASGPDDAGTATLATTKQECPPTPAPQDAAPIGTRAPGAKSPGVTAPPSPAATPSPTPTPTPEPSATDRVEVLICGMDKVGTYTATFDRNGAEDGGELVLTAVRRRTAWWALGAVLAGIVAAWLANRAIELAKARSGKAESEQRRRATEQLYRGVAADLRIGGPDLARFADVWAPQRWESLAFGSKSTDPTPEAAAELYARAAVCVAPLVQAWMRFRGSAPGGDPLVGEETELGQSARLALQFGIAPHVAGDTPQSIVQRLDLLATNAHVAVREDRYLQREIDRDPTRAGELQPRRDALADSKLEDVETALDAAGSGGPEYRREAFTVLGEHVWQRSWAAADVVRFPTAGPPPNPVRAALASRRASRLAIVIGLLAAVLVGMTDALDPTAAWGTWADLVKMFGAAMVLPTVLDQARAVASSSD